MTTYRDEMGWAYHGEVYGEAMFSALADAADGAGDAERTAQLRLMALIERQTRHQLGALCDREGIERQDEPWEARGRAYGTKAGRPSWDWERFWRSFTGITTEALPRYRVMRDELAPAGDAPTMQALVTHEQVLQSFADGLLDGRDDPGRPVIGALEGEHRAEADRIAQGAPNRA
jgi:hypothetical protein